MATTPGAFDGNTLHLEGEVTFETLITADLMKHAYLNDGGVPLRDPTNTEVAVNRDPHSHVSRSQPKVADASGSTHDALATDVPQSNEEAVSDPAAASHDADAVAAYELACESWEPDFDDDDDYRTSEHAQTPKRRDPEVYEESQVESYPSRNVLPHQKSFDKLLEAQSEEAVRAAAQSAWVQKLRTGVDPSAKRTTMTGSAGRQRAKVTSVVVKESMPQHPLPAVDHADVLHDVDSERTSATRPLATSNLNDSDADRRARQLALLECRAFLQTATKPGQKVRPPYDESLTNDPRSSANTLPKARAALPKAPSTPARGRPAFAPAPKGHSGPWATVAASSHKQPSPRALEAAKIQAQSRIPPPPGFIPPHIRAANAAKAARIQILQTQKAAQESPTTKLTTPTSLRGELDQSTTKVPAGQVDTNPLTLAQSQAVDALASDGGDERCSSEEGGPLRSRTSPTQTLQNGILAVNDARQLHKLVAPPIIFPLEGTSSETVARFSIDQLKSCSPSKALSIASCSRCDRLATHLMQMTETDAQPLCFPCFTVDDRIDDAVDVITGEADISGSWEMVPTDLKGFSIARKKPHNISSAVQKSAVTFAPKGTTSYGHHTSPVLRATTPASVEEITGSEWQVAASRQTKVKDRNVDAAVELAIPNGNQSEHIDPVARSPALDFKAEEAAEISGVPHGSPSKQYKRSISCTSNRSAAASSTMSASALPFASFSHGRETSPMSSHFWVPPAPNTLQAAARLALSPPIQPQQIQSVQAFGPVSTSQPCPQLERQIALFGQNVFAHQPPNLPLGQSVMPTFGPPHPSSMLFQASPPSHPVPLFAPPGLASVPAYGHADFEVFNLHDNHLPAAPTCGFHHDRYRTYPAHATYQTIPMPAPLPGPTPQSHRRDSSRSVSKAVPIIKPTMATSSEREPSAPNAGGAAIAGVSSEQQFQAHQLISDHDEDLATSPRSAADVPASQSETKDILTETTLLDMEAQSIYKDGLEKCGLGFANDTVATTRADADVIATESSSPTMDKDDVVEDVTSAVPANKLARNGREAAREALTTAWYARDTFRAKLNGSYSLDRAQAFATATKEYNAKRKELAASIASGELNEEDAVSFPFLSPNDTTVPKVRPKALAASAAAIAPPGNNSMQPAKKENEPSPHPPCVDSTCTTCSEPLYKIALTKTIHALQTLIKARRMSSQRCKKCQDHFCLGGTPSKGDPKLHAATEYYRRSRNKLVEVSGGSLREDIGYNLPDPDGGCGK
ncbi:hypothetical protein B0A48_10885 [Cryoendolithus antarcticus]|uniref:Uncharacterized protein n=1 Tax=Cryoendolithus antarcticus TaxID=1507870 RepID=A0A1V8SYW5_9PEZI|nr:hypothetical protein B0A48_10885 [Cryoendolithus antarcticus]